MVLEKINSSQDLKGLNLGELNSLAVEVRARLVEVVSRTGGHLASSLGAVDLIIALHYCLDTPKDKIIFDVGHQAYAHKILTGRNSKFSTLRQYAGLSGFPSKDESIYDPFTTGHSSNAVSLGLGLACARDLLSKKEQFKVVCVIGDGSLSGGLCFEGLNNAGHLKKDILVILNTNELSIAPNVGAISNYLNKIISLPVYNRFHDNLVKFLTNRVPRGSRLIKLMAKFEEGLKGLFVPGMLFEELGFRYFGPIDGHDLGTLTQTLKNIINIRGPRLLHVVTKKGKGYSFAEKDPVRFHGISCFDMNTGEVIPKKSSPKLKSYTEIFRDKIVELAHKDKRILAVTAAMPEGTGLDKFRDSFPERFFDVGIAEAHAVCFAAGLAKQGFKPVVAVYSTFLQRAYDQIIQEVSLQELPVIFAIDRAGIVGEDGVTHQGIFDIAYLKSIPNLVVMAPKDGRELEAMFEFALGLDKPVAIRYPRANTTLNSNLPEPLKLGKAELIKEGKDFTIIALGSMVSVARDAVGLLSSEGLSGNLVNARFVAPLDIELMKMVCVKAKLIFTVEEGIKDAGFGSSVVQELNMQVVRIGLPSGFIPHGPRELLLEKYGLTALGIAANIRQALKNNG
ncbi:MAG: 1-deoxy-D-xylulose-5-phosphate synthase [Candidatus Omnitrophica bacterium]|nr:1-deoxy-D-xylulose-5-phosphate synthase [Candidatus Omnitrophota bacterium]MBU1923913.1 1-deoxy-D-xylulose-5-phosphate synthase [Candidatus Omnitrophota bacterium]